MHFEYNLRGVMTALFRRKASFALVFAIVAFIGSFYVFHAKPVYEASGSVLVKFGQGALPALNRDGQQQIEYSANDRDEIIQSNIQILQSRDLLEAVIQGIGVERIYPGITAAVRGKDTPEQAAISRLLENDLKVTTDSKSDVIDIRVKNADPVIAQKFTQSLMDLFIARQSEIYAAPQTAFLQQQIDAAKLQLQKSQEAFQAFKQKQGISVIDGEISELLAEKSALTERAFQAVTDSQMEVNRLQSEAAQMMSTYRADSPEVQRLNRSLEAARDQVRQRQNEMNDSTTSGPLADKIAAINGRLAMLEANRSRYNELQQRVTMDEDSYKYYRQRGEEARVSDQLNRENITRISVVDKPVVPVKPANVHRLLLMAAILMTALLASLGSVFGREFLDDTAIFPEQVFSGTGLPVLAGFEN